MNLFMYPDNLVHSYHFCPPLDFERANARQEHPQASLGRLNTLSPVAPTRPWCLSQRLPGAGRSLEALQAFVYQH